MSALRDQIAAAGLRQGTVKRVFRYMRPHFLALATLAVVIVFDAVLAVFPPLLYQRIVDGGILARDMHLVVTLSLLALCILLISGLARLLIQWLEARLGEGLVHRLRVDVFTHIQGLPISFFTHQPTGALISRVNNDTAGTQTVISGLFPTLISSCVRIVSVLGTITFLSWHIALVVIILPMLTFIAARWVARYMLRLSHANMRATANLSTFVAERFNVAGALLLQLYGNRRSEQQAFTARSLLSRNLRVRSSIVGGAFATGLESTAMISLVGVYLIGGYMAISSQLTIGSIIAITALLPQLYGPINALSSGQVGVMDSLASFERIFDVFDSKSSIQEADHPITLTPATPIDIEIDGVTFGYPNPRPLDDEGASLELPGRGEPVLNGIDLRIEAGQRVALVGPSGSGKSTITSLLVRLYDPDHGSIRVGGHDIRILELESLRNSIGVLSQDVYLFHDTIRANLCIASPHATDEELRKACEASQIWSVIERLPDGLDTVVGDHGYRMSGGEKQRLAIARLLLKRPAVVVLDEATAHLDNDSETEVQRALDEAFREHTTLVIAHRLSTVRDADEIIVVSHGRIVERGTHQELMAKAGMYKQLYDGKAASNGRVSV